MAFKNISDRLKTERAEQEKSREESRGVNSMAAGAGWFVLLMVAGEKVHGRVSYEGYVFFMMLKVAT